MKGKAGRVYSLTPKGDAAMKAVKAYIETLDTEMKKLDGQKAIGDNVNGV